MGWVHGFGVRRSLGASAAAVSVALSGALVIAAPASALTPSVVVRTADAGGGTAEIGGRIVVPGTGKPPAGTTVSLHGVPPSGDAIDRTAIAKADGSFTFKDLAGGDWAYTITAPYSGATFSTDPVQVPVGQGLSLKLPVFTTTDSPAKVKTSSWIVWLDVTGDKVSVEQNMSYTNSGTTAFVGTTPVTGTTPPAKAAVELSVAPQASNFQYLGRFEVCCSADASGFWAHTRPIDPGGSSGTLRYEAPRPTSLAFKAQFPADSMTLLAPKGTAISSPQLKLDGSTTDKGTTYDVYRSTGAIKAADTITVSLSAAAAEGSTTPWWLVALVVVVLLAVAGAVVALLRRRRTPTAPPAAARPKGAKVASASPKAPAPKPARPAKAAAGAMAAQPAKAVPPPKAATADAAPRSKAEVLAEQLAQLDLKFENGELTDEAAYRRVRETLVQQLVDTVAGDPTSLG